VRIPRAAVLAGAITTGVVTALAMLGAGGAAWAAKAGPAAKAPGWRISHSFGTANTGLDGIQATSPASAWAVGQSAAQTPLVYKYAGGHWRAVSRPGPAGSFIGSAAASSTSNVWLALENLAAVDHWNGHRWRRITYHSTAQVSVSGVTTTGWRDVWVFTYDFGTKTETARHYDGHAWTTRTLPAVIDSSGYAQVSQSSPRDIWAWAYDSATSRYQTLHYNGSSWHVIKLPGLGISPSDAVAGQMLALSGKNVWATMYPETGTQRAVLLHWTGHAWHRIGGKLPAGVLNGPIASDGHGGLWVSELSYPHAYLGHYSGGKWTRWSVPRPKGDTLRLSALALIPGTRSLWATDNLNLGFGTTSGADILKYGR
jgi:hypothetical protein